MFFRQVQQHGDNFSYLIGDEATREAAVVDSSYNAGELSRLLKAHDYALKYIVNTHGHSDHTAGNFELASSTKAKIVAYKQSKAHFDLPVDDADTIMVGKITIKVIYTPGHTTDSICLLVDDTKLLTGDTLFVGECGRTDLPGGNSKSMYESLFGKISKLNNDIQVYPGHDYGSKPYSTIGEEKASNYTLKHRSLAEFVEFMRQP